MTEADHFGLWACSLALSATYHHAYMLHEGFSQAIELGDHEALRWATTGERYLAEEANKEGGK